MANVPATFHNGQVELSESVDWPEGTPLVVAPVNEEQGDIQENGCKPPDALTVSQWCEQFEAWADSHRHLPQPADDSRESIYSGQGE